ncbi:S-layer homology domain-containing protein [Paenibacillus filicis]|uniref:S-layer homology domain-containing protein n=1 Tax=Paenibacillus filicis TaxID=669464 RepID=A0ABU9DVT3_9BACL
MSKRILSLMMALSIGSGSLLSTSVPVRAVAQDGVPILPAQDVTVYSGGYYIHSNLIANESANYHKAAGDGGDTDLMRVGLDADGSAAYTYVQYDISALPAFGLNTEAALQFSGAFSKPAKVSVYGIHPMQIADQWSENTMTWLSQFRTLTDSIDTIEVTDQPGTHRFNVTDFVKAKRQAGATSIGVMIKAETATAIELRGHETSESAASDRIPALVIHQGPTGLHVPKPYTAPVPFTYGKNMPPLHDAIVYNPATTGNTDGNRNYHGTNNTATIADGMTVEFNKTYAYFKFDISNLPEPAQIGQTLFSVWGRDTSKATSAAATNYVQIFGAEDGGEWTETGITWNNKPKMGTTPIAEVLYKAANDYQDADITQYVKQRKQQGAQTITLVMAAKSNAGAFYHRGKDTTAGGQSPPRLMVGNPADAPEDMKLGADGRSRLYPEDWYPGFKDQKGRFLHDFSYTGYHRGEIPLPDTNGLQRIDVTQAPYLADSTGNSDSTAAIQQAIYDAGAQGGGVVYLPAGTYQVSAQPGKDFSLSIPSSSIVLKGAGMNKTFLYNATENMKSKDIIRVGDGDWRKTGTSTKLSKSVTEPTVLLPVEDASSFDVNDYVLITFDTTPDFLSELGMQNKWASRLGKVEQLFYRQIVGVDKVNRTITLDIPTRYALKQRDNITITKTDKPVSEVGLEDFSIANIQNSKSGLGEDDYKIVGTAAYEADNAKAVNMIAVADSWIRNVNTYKPAGNANYHILSKGIILDRTKNVTVSNVTMEYPQYRGANGNGYLYQFIGNDNLIENSRAIAARHSFTYANFSANGNVLHQVYSENSSLLTDFHMYLSMANLIDNMTLNGDGISAITRDYGSSATNRHGVVTTESVFWNTTGQKAHSSKNGIIIESEQFGNGYIIGTKGAVTGVKVDITGSIPEADTRPFDMAEGVGEGDRLSPQSLYTDQFSRRTEDIDLGLQSLLINGSPVNGMQFLKTKYAVTLPYGTVQTPVIEATPFSAGAAVTITQPAGTSGTGIIKVSRGGSVKEYQVVFQVATAPVLPKSITLAPDKSVQGWRAAGNAISAGSQGKLKSYLTLDNGEVLNTSAVGIPVTYTVNNEEVGRVEGNVFHALRPGIVKVTAESRWNGATVRVTENFEVKERMPEPEGIFADVVRVSASADDGNLPINTIDRDPDSRWSAEGSGQYLVQELSKAQWIDKISLLFFSGNLRASTFDVEVSTDGIHYEKVLTRAVSTKPNPNQPETFAFTPVQAKFVKFIGYGNELNGWNSIIESWIHLEQGRVTGISVSGADDVHVIKEAGGKLQMKAVAEPAGAPLPSVTWSVYEADGRTATDKAWISGDGWLTAVKNGVVQVTAAATDGSGLQGSALITISGQPGEPVWAPYTTIGVPESVYAGKPLSAAIGLRLVTGSVYAAVYGVELTLTYDPSVVTYVSALSLKPGFIIQSIQDAPDKGQVRIVAAAGQAGDAITSDGELIQIHWQVKPLSQPATSRLAVVSAALTYEEGQHVQALASTAEFKVNIASSPGGTSGGNDDNDSPSGSSSPAAPSAPAPQQSAKRGEPVKVNVVLSESVQGKTADGRSLVTAELAADALEKALQSLKAEEKSGEVRLLAELKGQEDVGQVRVSAQAIGAILEQAPKSILTIAYDSVRYELPLQALRLIELARELNADLQDVKISFRIGKLAGPEREKLEAQAKESGARLLHPGISFEVTAESGGKQVVVDDFAGVYAPRTIELAGRVSERTAAAVWYDPATGDINYVPAKFLYADGKTRVTIYRTGNSLYTVVQADKAFSDLAGHWAQGAVESLASKFLVKGVSDTSFAPDQAITRAEFSALLTRAIGLAPKAADGYKDVAASDWYACYVGAASRAGIVNGFEDGTFKPAEQITREQMAVMIVRALTFTGYTADPQAGRAALSGFADGTAVSGYAGDAVAAALHAGIIVGVTDTELAPQNQASRAEAAVMLERVLGTVIWK